MRGQGFRRLPLFWKLLVPYVGLLVIIGTLGAFLITRDLASRAQGALNEQLLQVSLRAKALLHEKELYLLESANLGANLEGMADASRNRDAETIGALLTTVLALKEDLNLVVVTDTSGVGLVEFSRESSEANPQRGVATKWSGNAFVDTALTDGTGKKAAGSLEIGGRRSLAIAAPICSRVDPCTPVGVAIVATDLERLATQAAGGPQKRSHAGLTIFDTAGKVLAKTDATPGKPVSVRISGDTLVRRTEKVGDTEVHTLYSTYEVQGNPVGMIALSLPSAPAFASVRGAAFRLVVILLFALAGIITVGALLSRFILAQTRPLLATNRALGQGDLSARAPVVTNDEIGELASGLNQMADQLQASYETLESRVEQRTEEIQRLLRERTEFFASLSHELRTPIALVISHGEMLIDPDFRKTQRAIEARGEVIRDSGQQLLAVVNDILDLARLEAGSVRVEIRDVSLAEVLAGLLATLRGLASAADIKLQVDVPATLPAVRADAARMREVILNLVDNAVKYTPRRGTVRVSLTAEQERVSLSVADTGVGIPPEAQEHIFQPFFRAGGTETQRGEFSTGLGLAIAKKLVEAQSGEISFQSQLGQGTVFTVSLPVGDSSSQTGALLKPIEGKQARRVRADGRRGQPRALVS
ncbi:MAG: HAMP domain-containing sensor histidine kinase [Actinomycetota bacterium]